MSARDKKPQPYDKRALLTTDSSLVYVLPKFEKDSHEHFFHIHNLLEHLARKMDVHVIIEKSDGILALSGVKSVRVINNSTAGNNLSRFFKMMAASCHYSSCGIRLFFCRSSLTGIIPVLLMSKIMFWRRCKVVFWNCGQDVVPLSLTRLKDLRRATLWLVKWAVLRSVDYLATGPEKMVAYYQSAFGVNPSRILLLYNDVSLQRFRAPDAAEKSGLKRQFIGKDIPLLLFVHTFNVSRGTDLLVPLACALKNRGTACRILAIGREGDYSDKLRALIRREAVGDIIDVLGPVANKDIVPYYQAADLFLMPSRGEGFPRVVLESMACGVAPLCFDVGGVADIIPSELTGQFLVPVNTEAFLSAAVNLAAKPGTLTDMGAICRRHADRFSTEKVSDMYYSTFTRLLRESATP
jgi:glycosyltransferase involved in cell wall biosynthesis